MFWLKHFGGEEPYFWRRLNPARCAALYREYARTHLPRRSDPARRGGSLSQYLMGGGG